MDIISIKIFVYGKKFSPKEFIKNINEPYFLLDSTEPIEFDDEDSDWYGFGCIHILHPQKICLQYEDEEYQIWYVEFLEKYYQILKDNGANKIDISWSIYYSKQINIEIFNRGLLKRLLKFDVAINLNGFKRSSKAIRELLLEKDLTREQILFF